MEDIRNSESFKKIYRWSLIYMCIVLALWGSYLFYDTRDLKINGNDVINYLASTKMALYSKKYIHHITENKKRVICTYSLMLPQLLTLISCYLYHKKCSKVKEYDKCKWFTKFIIGSSFLILLFVLVAGQYMFIYARGNSLKRRSTLDLKTGSYKVYTKTNYEDLIEILSKNNNLDEFDQFILDNNENFKEYLTSYEEHNKLDNISYIVVKIDEEDLNFGSNLLIPLTKEANVNLLNGKDSLQLTVEYTDFWTNLEGNAVTVIMALNYLQEGSEYTLTEVYLE